MVSLYCCIVDRAHLGIGTGHITVTMAAPLLPTSGHVRYEAVLHSCAQAQWMCVWGGGEYQLVTGLENARYRFEPATFRFLDLPGGKAGALLIRPH